MDRDKNKPTYKSLFRVVVPRDLDLSILAELKTQLL